MTPRFHGFRVPSARLPPANYHAGWFFVTLVAAGRRPCLGRVVGDAVRLSPAGVVVADEWARTAIVRPGVTLDAFVVMPDHVHGVLVLADTSDGDRRDAPVGRLGTASDPSGNAMGRGAEGDAPSGRLYMGDAGRPDWRPGTLGAVVNHFKGACTRRIRAEVDPGFAWQPRFHDAIVRDARHLENVRRYIAENPARWTDRRGYSAPAGAPEASVAIATRMSSAEAAEATAASRPMVASRSA